MTSRIIKKIFNKQDEIEHPEKFKNFDEFLLGEIIDYLSYIRGFMNPTVSTAGLLAKTDSILAGFRHAYLADGQAVACSCCKYLCAGSNCRMVKDAWQFFLEEMPNFEILFVKTEL